MTEYMHSIEAVIKKAAIDGALTDGAVKQFNDMVNANEELRGNIKGLEADAERFEKAITVLRQERDDARLVRDELIKREDDLKERETKITRLELVAEFCELRRLDVMTCFDTVFKNVTLRKEVMTAVPGLKADQYGSSHSPYAHKEEVSEKEE